ncbi:hypothetical protein V1J52_15790 [Streptomyces sp. TRM 70351]|uniref:hypothetical protein n=1 Tax=Streptomyces sp. TRM 70351 TaxID=3116552 RepID=UPI002E7B8027|nr:hypothetical protein [Streptomyces sp. TRM 70351]MEE1929628.1 hypothetical protein [Streptomyces sp. TRM 70351]
MGIESEKLVFDYLSRVGDLAHGTTMTAAERARLVGELRTGIDRMRSPGGTESAAEVRRILRSFGRPEDVVAAADSTGALPEPRPPGPLGRRGGPGRRGRWRGPSPGASAQAVPAPSPATGSEVPDSGASPPHLAGLDELSAAGQDLEWWRDGPVTETGGGEVPGFTGGIEVPEMLRPPGKDGEPRRLLPPQSPGAQSADARSAREQDAAPPAAVEQEAPRADAAPPARRRRLRRLRRAAGNVEEKAAKVPGIPRAGGPVELLAALALVAGTVTGSFIALGAGWLLAWWSPRLQLAERKWAVLGMPGTVAGAAVVWLWGRAGGRWGEPIAEGGMREVLDETYPWLVRAAALASALFLLWRARRPAGG